MIPLFFLDCLRYLKQFFSLTVEGTSDSHEDKKQNGSCQELEGAGNGELLVNGYRVSALQDDEKPSGDGQR